MQRLANDRHVRKLAPQSRRSAKSSSTPGALKSSCERRVT
jgi:hypothetical protein